MSNTKTITRSAPAYETDFYAWTQDQARRLRELRPNSIDWGNVAEEIESLGRSQKHEIESRMNVLLVHLLTWYVQPTKRKSGWRATIVEQRRRISREIKDSPSLSGYPGRALAEEYEIARLRAAGETKLAEDVFPEHCPFTIEQILDPDFYPDTPGE